MSLFGSTAWKFAALPTMHRPPATTILAKVSHPRYNNLAFRAKILSRTPSAFFLFQARNPVCGNERHGDYFPWQILRHRRLRPGAGSRIPRNSTATVAGGAIQRRRRRRTSRCNLRRRFPIPRRRPRGKFNAADEGPYFGLRQRANGVQVFYVGRRRGSRVSDQRGGNRRTRWRTERQLRKSGNSVLAVARCH